MSRWIGAAALSVLLLTASGAPATGAQAQNAPISAASMLRFHIVANSKSAQDLAAKLAVRDAVVDYLGPRLTSVRTAAEAEAELGPLTGRIQAIADATLRGYGLRYGAKVSLDMAELPARSSPAGTLPAGRYPSLVVLLGRAKGQNWWCLLFPQFCSSDRAASYGFSEGRNAAPRELSLLTPEVSLLSGDRVRPGGLIWHFWKAFGGAAMYAALALR